MLTKDLAPFLQVSSGVIITMIVATGIFFIFAVTKGMKIQWRKPISGKESITGMVGIARTDLNPDGQMFVHGEIWQAVTSNGTPIKKGEKVVVISLEGLRLIVKKTEKKEE